jgi:DNA invertase Pin-like site-specific DNA recombinase
LANYGEKIGTSKLTEVKVIQIIKLLKAGVHPIKIAKAFKVSKTTIRDIGNNKAWVHIDRSTIEAYVSFNAEVKVESLGM